MVLSMLVFSIYAISSAVEVGYLSVLKKNSRHAKKKAA